MRDEGEMGRLTEGWGKTAEENGSQYCTYIKYQTARLSVLKSTIENTSHSILIRDSTTITCEWIAVKSKVE